MAESTTDRSILKKIEGLVHEEQHLYGKGELAPGTSWLDVLHTMRVVCNHG